MLCNDAIMRQCSLFFMHKPRKYALVEGTRMPLVRVVCLESSDIEATVDACNSTVTKER